MFQEPQVSTDDLLNNNTNGKDNENREDSFLTVDHEEVVVDHDAEHVTNFERLMKLFPNEHPSGIHGIMVICNNNIEKALDMLLYITQCRKLQADKAGVNNNRSATESDLEILEESLKKIDERSDDDDDYDDDSDEDYTPEKFKATSSKKENSMLKKATKRLLKLGKFENPKKKTPRFTVPTKASLKAVYTDNNSQFVRIEDMD